MVASILRKADIALKLTPARLVNAFRIWYSFRRSVRTGKAIVSGMPLALSIEPTTSCNLRCPQCPSGLRQFTRPKGMLSPEMFEKILTEAGPSLGYLTFYFQGEPFLNPDFLKMVKMATDRNIFTATSTNAHYLNYSSACSVVNSGLRRLIISLDGITQESYEKYRVGGDLNKVFEGIRNLARAKASLRSPFPEIVIQFIVFSHNEHEMEKAKSIAKGIGANKLVFKTAQIYDEEGIDLLPQDKSKSRYEVKEGKAAIKGELPDECWRMWHSCVITWDGLVVPCCFDKDAKYRFGDLKEESFSVIWKGEKYRAFREKLLLDRRSIDICSNCSEGAKVWV